MKQTKQTVCPGCSRHCPMGAEHCKYGRRYFAKLAETEQQKTYKWEKYVEKNGLVWQLLMTARRIKKTLRSQKLTEEQLLAALDQEQRQQFSELKKKMEACAQKPVSEPRKTDIP